MTEFRIVDSPINPQNYRLTLSDERFGACVEFEGWVRSENLGRKVTGLTYEAWGPLCQAEAQVIFEEARERFQVSRIMAVHRTGELKVGETAVWVAVASPHRKEAFAACAFVIDEIKHRLPIWKKEHYADGTQEWVACHRCSAGSAAQTQDERGAGLSPS